MQPHDSSRFRSPRPNPHSPSPPEAGARGSAAAQGELAPELPFAATRVVLAAPALLVEARFRDVPLASRLLRADEARAFTVGAARGADAPVNPAYLGAPTPSSENGAVHALVEPVAGGFALNLAPAMRAELVTPVQVLPLRPDFGRAEAPLALPPDAFLHVTCGEVAFHLFAAEPAATVPRPRFGAALRTHARYEAGVALAFLALLFIVRAIPDDPRSVSLDDLERSGRLSSMVTIPLTVNSPEVTSAIASKTPGGGGSKAARGPQGAAGDKRAKPADARRTVAGNTPQDARDVAGEIKKNSILQFLDGPTTGALGEVMDNKPVLGPDALTKLGHLEGTNMGAAYGTGLAMNGTGEYGGGTGEHTLGRGTIGTLGKFGAGDGSGEGPGRGYGHGVGVLGTRKTITPQILQGIVTSNGSLDKDIIRRIVRRHLNEVKYCYELGLAKQPKLDGRVVVKFTISGTGQVLASFIQSSTLGATAVEMCVVNAVKRWEFPAPEKGGLAFVSYPFQFSPAGN